MYALGVENSGWFGVPLAIWGKFAVKKRQR
jgi:hypothetical protein